MGRKIPGRKHHGVRDPEKQKQHRLSLIKDKINAPPTNSDDQQIPKSLTKLIDLKNKVKTGAISLKRVRKRKKSHEPISSHPHGVKPPEDDDKPVPYFRQEKNESDEKFMHRVCRICHNVVQEAKFEEKYGVTIRRNNVTGEVEVVKRKKDEIEEYYKKVKKEMKNKGVKKKKKDQKEGPKLTKSQKRALKLKARKEKLKILKDDEFKSYKDKVGFGEVVHAPPTLTAPRKAGNTQETQRPGKKDLILKSLLKSNDDNPKKSKDHKKTEHKVIDKKGKRKDLPAAMRRQLDKQQQEVIQAYKLLKAKRYVNNKE